MGRVATPTIALRHRRVYLSLLELHPLFDVTAVTEPIALLSQEKREVRGMRLVTLTALLGCEGRMPVPTVQIALHILVAFEAQPAF